MNNKIIIKNCTYSIIQQLLSIFQQNIFPQDNILSSEINFSSSEEMII